MGKLINCSAKDIPFGSKLVDDVYTDNGVLLCKKDSIVDERTKKLLLGYRGKIRITLSDDEKLKAIQKEFNLSDEVIKHISPDEIESEDSLELTEEIKEEALKGVASIYNAKNTPEKISGIANELSDKILENISSSSSVNINLSKLKICDDYTYKHSIDVATMAVLVARALNYDEAFQKDIITAGILHDVGKIKVPLEVLNKNGRLTKEEFSFIQNHPVAGYELLKDCKDINENIKLGVLGHHESMDGNGYPNRLEGDDVPLIARILAIVDVYDALVTDRPYRRAMMPADALEIMFTMSNKFDPIVFKAFLKIIIAYPVGSIVMTSLGESCIVLGQNEGYPLRPVIKDLNTDEVIDLAHDYNSMSVIITEFINE